jgi:hypothetical protein
VTPVSNRGIGYAACALFDRAEVLEMLSAELTRLAFRAAVQALAKPLAPAFAERARDLAAEISKSAAALRRAGETLAPEEALRARVARDGALVPVVAALGGGAWLWRQIDTGSAWMVVRPLATALLSSRQPAAAANYTVSITARPSGAVVAPQTLEDRVRRIPDGDTHIRIERFGERVELYLSGTNFVGGPTDPWNALSNVDLARTASAASLVAVRTALTEASVTPTTPITMTGHSQGGLIALALAESGSYRVEGVITVGTPAGIIGDTPGVPTIHLIHPTDPVPPLGGLVSHTSATWVIEPDGGGALFDVHHNSAYVSSARHLDELRDFEVERLLARVNSSGRGLRSDVRAVTEVNP